MFHSEANKLRGVCNGSISHSGVAHSKHAHFGRHAIEITHAFGDGVVAQSPAKSRRNGDPGRGFIRQRRRVGIQENFVDRRKLTEQAQECNQFRRCCRADGPLEQLGFNLRRSGKATTVLAARKSGQHVRSHLPGSRRGPGVYVGLRVSIVQESRFEAQESDDLRPDFGLHGPSAPVNEIGFEIEMDESVSQRPRHREVHTAVGGRITGCDHHPPLGSWYSPSFLSRTNW